MYIYMIIYVTNNKRKVESIKKKRISDVIHITFWCIVPKCFISSERQCTYGSPIGAVHDVFFG